MTSKSPIANCDFISGFWGATFIVILLCFPVKFPSLAEIVKLSSPINPGDGVYVIQFSVEFT